MQVKKKQLMILWLKTLTECCILIISRLIIMLEWLHLTIMKSFKL